VSETATGFQDYIADVLTDHIASKGQSDFLISQGEDLVYVDVENATFFLIRIREAEAVVPVRPDRIER
jgi:hypothetical protein